MDRTGHARRTILICLLLSAVTLATYWPLIHNQFINYDDDEYVTDNPQVRAGLTWKGVGWAFTTDTAANWHPLTWISHMMDVQLFGLNAGWHHATNLALHIVNTLLLFLTFNRMTGLPWRCAFVAGFFSLHPMHVQSVAWIAERKDLLSACFFLLTVWAYSRYVVETNKQSAPQSLGATYYCIAIGLFALGLMSKPMLVTLPFVLVLLDYWPLKRTPSVGGLLKLLPEKIPFFLLSAIASFITFRVQRSGGAVATYIGFWERAQNAVLSYGHYLIKAFWPSGFSVFYPYSHRFPFSQVLCASLIILVFSIGVFFLARRFGFLFTGWFWFVGMLVPVIGLVQVGEQSMADRYTYLPYIGLFAAVVWGSCELTNYGRIPFKYWVPISASALTVCAIIANKQTDYWHDSERLFRHALVVTRSNNLAEFSLSNALIDKGQFSEGFSLLRKVLERNPSFAEGHARLAYVLASQGKFSEAVKEYDVCLGLKPDLPGALNNLAWLRATNPDPALRNGTQAVQLAQRACELTRYQKTIFIGTLAAAFAESGRYREAIAAAEQARNNALKWQETSLAEKNEQLLGLYREDKPYRENPK